MSIAHARQAPASLHEKNFCPLPTPMISRFIHQGRHGEEDEEDEEEDEEEGKKGVPTHLVPKEMELRGVDERVRRRARFYTAPAPPQAHSHCTQAVIFQQTHLQSKISYLVAQAVLCFRQQRHFISSFLTCLVCHVGSFHVPGGEAGFAVKT